MKFQLPVFVMIRTGVFIVTLFLIQSCNNLYKAGNLYYLGIPIETDINYSVILSYTDSLKSNYGFGVPDKWKYYNKLVDIDSINNKIIYFSKSPEEMFLVSISGQLMLSDVYNENIKEGDWVTEEELLSQVERTRILKRFKDEYLNKIEQLAKRNGLPDSLLYDR